MQVLTEEADACCKRAWEKAADAGALDALDAWECPMCGQAFKVVLGSSLRFWEAFVWSARW